MHIGIRVEVFVEAMRPGASLRGHLTFHLKHEVPHLEMLCRLFERVDPAELAAYGLLGNLLLNLDEVVMKN